MQRQVARDGSDFEEASMGLRFEAAAGALALMAVVAGASAQDVRPESIDAASASTPRSTLTGKERLGPKWTDEQRIDNCHVPLDKRGTKHRPNCPTSPSS